MRAKSKSREKTKLIYSGANGNPRNRILIGTASLGIVRLEWSVARYSQIVPCNWSAGHLSCGIGAVIPMHYLVADAQNVIADEAIRQNYEWVLLHEDDVIVPPDLFIRLNHYMKDATIPVVSGLYYLKTPHKEPVLYRGHGNGAFDGFKLGEKVWADGVPTGCLLIHCSILKLMWQESEEYVVGINPPRKVRKIFETPGRSWFDASNHGWKQEAGTSDLAWCKRVIEQNVLRRSGWPKIGRKKYPFLCDTNIFCRHIDLQTGRQYPLF